MSAGYAFDWDAFWRARERNEEWWAEITWRCAECDAANTGWPSQGCEECGYVGEEVWP